jgi:hypothetical protein
MLSKKILNAFHFISLASPTNSKEPKTDVGEQVVNATIQGGLAVFTTLSTMGALGLVNDWKIAVASAFIAFGLGFFTSLATQRGLSPKTGGST